jgi:type II secretory pathway component GspD/PulD (secretin)
MKLAKALAALGVVAATGTAQVIAQDQSEPRIQIDARIVVASRDAAGKFGVDMVAQPADSAARGLSVGTLNSVAGLDDSFSALERAGKGRVLARPSLIVGNDTEGEILHGFQVPTQTVTNNTVTVSWQDHRLDLKVRPSVTPANTVALQVTLTTPSAQGKFMTRDGTLVIGGIALGPNPELNREVLVFLTPRIVE